MQKISLVIPTFNEEGNIQKLIQRIDAAMHKNNITYEVIFVDDHSTDHTREIISLLVHQYPISLYIKKGKKGKSYSLLEGFSYAKYQLICMIDADLQYPPEIIPEMMLAIKNGDVVIANRKDQHISKIRAYASRMQSLIFNKFLHSIDHDVQSGLKVFKKEIIERISLHPTPWTFDLEFLIQAKNSGYTIVSIDITFFPRNAGSSKINMLRASIEIAYTALKLRFKDYPVTPFHPTTAFKKGKGFHYKGAQFIHHSELAISETAFFRLTKVQQRILFFMLVIFFISLLLNWHFVSVISLSFLTVLYFVDLLFSLFLILKNFNKKQIEIDVPAKYIESEREWPSYTIFCPLYKEANVLPQFVNAIESLDYPKDKLQVMLLLEEDDKETQLQAKKSNLPSYITTQVIPHSFPKTKPKALNFGLNLATGDYIVIYDAEDMPDPKQLKKVVVAYEKRKEKIGCIQAKLNFYNPTQNLLTRIFTAEYSLWFDLILTGLQSIEAPIPLGGTSNHFQTKTIKQLGGWDSFNVTEDCDLGIRLARNGYKTAIVNSTTLEEANSDISNWFTQRGRWIKGYIQSYFVHIRNPKKFLQSASLKDFILFQIIVGGKIMSLFINPLLWAITIIYFVFRPTVGALIESFFPGPIFYIGILSLVFGNFLYLYYYMIATIKRENFSITKYALFVPFYWLCMSIAGWNALYKMIVQPHYWAKTIHGLHLNKQEKTIKQEEKIVLPSPYKGSITPVLSE